MSDPPGYAVVGLGNPGPDYAATRHNIGRMVVEDLARRGDVTLKAQRRSNCEIASLRWADTTITLALTRTYMNESGGSVAALLRHQQIPPARLIVVHDELDLPFAALRVKSGGGDNGHNGLGSIRRALGTGDYLRVRIGIGRPPGRQDPADFVLRAFRAEERSELALLIDRAGDAAQTLVRAGLDQAQNEFNS